MMNLDRSRRVGGTGIPSLVLGFVVGVGLTTSVLACFFRPQVAHKPGDQRLARLPPRPVIGDQLDTSGFSAVYRSVQRWEPHASLDEISRRFERVGYAGIEAIDTALAGPLQDQSKKMALLIRKAALFKLRRRAAPGLSSPRATPLAGRDRRARGAGRVISRHLLPGRHCSANRRD